MADLKTLYLWNVGETNALNRSTKEFEVFYATDPEISDTSERYYQVFEVE